MSEFTPEECALIKRLKDPRTKRLNELKTRYERADKLASREDGEALDFSDSMYLSELGDEISLLEWKIQNGED